MKQLENVTKGVLAASTLASHNSQGLANFTECTLCTACLPCDHKILLWSKTYNVFPSNVLCPCSLACTSCSEHQCWEERTPDRCGRNCALWIQCLCWQSWCDWSYLTHLADKYRSRRSMVSPWWSPHGNVEEDCWRCHHQHGTRNN